MHIDTGMRILCEFQLQKKVLRKISCNLLVPELGCLYSGNKFFMKFGHSKFSHRENSQENAGSIILMLKNSSSLYLMISCLQRSQNFLGSCVTFLKTTCLHVSFTAYENFYKLSKNALSSQMPSTFFASDMSEIRNQIIIHISTYTLVHSSIITYMGDHFLVIFCP